LQPPVDDLLKVEEEVTKAKETEQERRERLAKQLVDPIPLEVEKQLKKMDREVAELLTVSIGSLAEQREKDNQDELEAMREADRDKD
jgi:flagellar motor switch/type III secretory pathway protein FliN